MRVWTFFSRVRAHVRRIALHDGFSAYQCSSRMDRHHATVRTAHAIVRPHIPSATVKNHVPKLGPRVRSAPLPKVRTALPKLGPHCANVRTILAATPLTVACKGILSLLGDYAAQVGTIALSARCVATMVMHVCRFNTEPSPTSSGNATFKRRIRDMTHAVKRASGQVASAALR